MNNNHFNVLLYFGIYIIQRFHESFAIYYKREHGSWTNTTVPNRCTYYILLRCQATRNETDKSTKTSSTVNSIHNDIGTVSTYHIKSPTHFYGCVFINVGEVCRYRPITIISSYSTPLFIHGSILCVNSHYSDAYTNSKSNMCLAITDSPTKQNRSRLIEIRRITAT